MTDFELRLNEVIRDYEKRHLEHPKSISLSFDFAGDLYGLISPINYAIYVAHRKPVYRGMPFKWVKRKNYIEALPRFKSQKQYFQEYATEWIDY